MTSVAFNARSVLSKEEQRKYYIARETIVVQCSALMSPFSFVRSVPRFLLALIRALLSNWDSQYSRWPPWPFTIVTIFCKHSSVSFRASKQTNSDSERQLFLLGHYRIARRLYFHGVTLFHHFPTEEALENRKSLLSPCLQTLQNELRRRNKFPLKSITPFSTRVILQSPILNPSAPHKAHLFFIHKRSIPIIFLWWGLLWLQYQKNLVDRKCVARSQLLLSEARRLFAYS